MHIYKRTIGLSGSHYTRDFDKKKHHKNKVRFIMEDTVAKHFKAGKAEIIVYFEETNETIHVTPESDFEIINKYLGSKFI